MAVFILTYLRSLRCLRNYIHSSLILSYCLTDVLWLLLFAWTHEKHFENSPLCMVLTTLLKLSIVTSFFWMLMEGVYLLIGTIKPFAIHNCRYWVFALFGWGIPLILIGIWLLLSTTNEDPRCYEVVTNYFDYVLHVPLIAVLLTNSIILIIVIRILRLKLNTGASVNSVQHTSTIRALLVLCPLLGCVHLLLLFLPSKPFWLSALISYLSSLFISTQSLFAVSLFCLFNREVMAASVKACRKCRNNWWQYQHFRRRSSQHSTSTRLYSFDLVPTIAPDSIVRK